MEGMTSPPADWEALSPSEIAMLATVRHMVGDDSLLGLPQTVVVQILRGNAADGPQVCASLVRKVAEWRALEGVDDILSVTNINRDAFEQHWRTGIIGRGTEGRIVVLEPVGRIEPTLFKAAFAEDLFIRNCIYTKEALRMYCLAQSHKLGRRVYKFNVVLDLDGLTLGKANGIIPLVKTYINCFGAYYPETLYKLYIVNAPFIFASVWALIKPMLHPMTAQKIHIFSGSRLAAESMEKDGLVLDMPLADAFDQCVPLSSLVASERLASLDEFVPEGEAPVRSQPRPVRARRSSSECGSEDSGATDSSSSAASSTAVCPTLPMSLVTTGAFSCDTAGRVVWFQLRGAVLRVYPREEVMLGADAEEEWIGRQGAGEAVTTACILRCLRNGLPSPPMTLSMVVGGAFRPRAWGRGEGQAGLVSWLHAGLGWARGRSHVGAHRSTNPWAPVPLSAPHAPPPPPAAQVRGTSSSAPLKEPRSSPAAGPGRLPSNWS